MEGFGNSLTYGGETYADFCSLAATLVAFTEAAARTVGWAAIANILKKVG